MKKLKGTPKKIVIRIVACISIVAVFCLTWFSTFFGIAMTKAVDVRAEMLLAQRTRLESLAQSYADGTAVKLNESDFCAFDLPQAIADGKKINALSVLGTHNSYKSGSEKSSLDFFHYAAFTNDYDYSFDTLTEQLNLGIRSLELDMAKAPDGEGGYRIECSHKYFYDNTSSAIDLLSALKEIKMWSDYNPSHLPITVLLEIKVKSLTAAPKQMTIEDIKAFGADAAEILGDTLFTSADVLNGYSDFAEMRAQDGYPEIDKALGKVILLLHDNPITYKYIDEYKLSDSPLLPILQGSTLIKKPQYAPYVCFAIQNKPSQKENMRALLDANYFIRTRLDRYPERGGTRQEDGIASGANILSTDYPPSLKNTNGYSVSLTEDGKTILLK